MHHRARDSAGWPSHMAPGSHRGAAAKTAENSRITRSRAASSHMPAFSTHHRARLSAL